MVVIETGHIDARFKHEIYYIAYNTRIYACIWYVYRYTYMQVFIRACSTHKTYMNPLIRVQINTFNDVIYTLLLNVIEYATFFGSYSDAIRKTNAAELMYMSIFTLDSNT